MSKRLQIGERIGEYDIVGFLGAGGMGSVYHGVHTKISRSAAIKVLSDVATNSTFKDRFFNEAKLQSSLHHPNIATLYDFQESGDVLFIVMEYVDGETLDALINRGYFSVEDALTTFESICDAVAFIHSNNIVHRDIKPQNIKLAANGMIKLLDFGIAKGAVSNGLTRVGGVIGTPNYLAPEQLAGKPATPQTDIWSLGVLFYSMLTGIEPFKGDSLAELYVQITTGKFESAEKLNPVVQHDVSRIVTKCLANDPAERYKCVNLIISDIQLSKRRYLPDLSAKERKASIFPKNAFINLKKNESHIDIDGAAGHEISAESSLGGRWRLILAGGAGIFVVFLIVGAFGIWALSGPAENTSGNVNRALNGRDTVPSPVKSLVPSANNRTISTQSAPASSFKEKTKVTVEVVEGSAEVFRNGQLLGTTPIDIEGTENESVDLVLKREGYQDEPVKIDITTRRKVFTFSLKRK